jgi:hypothetical protein
MFGQGAIPNDYHPQADKATKNNSGTTCGTYELPFSKRLVNSRHTGISWPTFVHRHPGKLAFHESRHDRAYGCTGFQVWQRLQ